MTSSEAVVVGGGPAGAASAIALARAGVRTLLVEARQRPGWRIGETLSPAASCSLEALQLGALSEAHLPAAGTVSAWGNDELRDNDFVRDPWGHGWQLDRATFEDELLEHATRAGVVLLRGARVREVVRAGVGSLRLSIAMADGTRCDVAAALAVDATGRSAVLSRGLGGQRRTVDRLVCVHWRLQTTHPDRDLDSRTLVEARPDGWWYSARTSSGRTLAWLTDADLLDRRWRSAGWYAERIQATEHVRALLRQGSWLPVGEPGCVSAMTARALAPVGAGWLAVGDAAMTHDPLSGRGLVHALASGVRAADAVVRALVGDQDALRRYSADIERSWLDHMTTRRLIHSLEHRWTRSDFWRRRLLQGLRG